MEKLFTLTCFTCRLTNFIPNGVSEPKCRQCQNIIAYSKDCNNCHRKFWGKKWNSLCKKCNVCKRCNRKKDESDGYCRWCLNDFCSICQKIEIPKEERRHREKGVCSDCRSKLICSRCKIGYKTSKEQYCNRCSLDMKCRRCHHIKMDNSFFCSECDLKERCIQCQNNYKSATDYCRSCNVRENCVSCNNKRFEGDYFCHTCMNCFICEADCVWDHKKVNDKCLCCECESMYQVFDSCRTTEASKEHITFLERDVVSYDGYDSNPYNFQYKIVGKIEIIYSYKLDLDKVKRAFDYNFELYCGRAGRKYFKFKRFYETEEKRSVILEDSENLFQIDYLTDDSDSCEDSHEEEIKYSKHLLTKVYDFTKIC